MYYICNIIYICVKVWYVGKSPKYEIFVLKLGQAVCILIYNTAFHDCPKMISSDIIENKYKSIYIYLYIFFKCPFLRYER